MINLALNCFIARLDDLSDNNYKETEMVTNLKFSLLCLVATVGFMTNSYAAYDCDGQSGWITTNSTIVEMSQGSSYGTSSIYNRYIRFKLANGKQFITEGNLTDEGGSSGSQHQLGDGQFSLLINAMNMGYKIDLVHCKGGWADGISTKTP